MNGKKRRLLVDTGELVVAVVVHPADVQDRDGALSVLKDAKRRVPGLEAV